MLCIGGSCFRLVTERRLTVAVEAGQSSEGTVKTELRENAVGLPGMLMHGLVLMYILANIGVVKYYLTEARDKFNPWLHVVVPVVASAAGVVVVWKSYFSPFTSSGPVYWGLLVFIAVLVLTILALIYLRVRGQEDWMRKAQLVFEQSGSGH
jgi:amino acid transporter